MNHAKVCIPLAALACVLSCTTVARAQIVTFTDRTSFTAAASALGTVQNEGFESLPTGTLPVGVNQLGLLTLNIGLVPPTTTTGASIGSTTPITGLRELSVNADTSFRTYDVSFGMPLVAAGFDYTGANTGGIAALRVDGQLFVFGNNGGGAGFFGFISATPLSSFSIEDQTPGLPTEIFESDNYSFVVVPEPTSLCFLAVATAVGVAVRRRRR